MYFIENIHGKWQFFKDKYNKSGIPDVCLGRLSCPCETSDLLP